ncbi:hypothetical protein QYF36_012033 [Acer negundo]|nr:hypothetical protein QYF36_012033 [Acer negundo]
MPLHSLYTVLRLLPLLLFTSAYADDSAAMLSLAQSLKNLPSGWSSKSSTGFCDNWTGVKCDSGSFVTSINLKGSKLTGSLSDAISSLSRLTSLSLQSNALSGAIPNLSKLSSSIQEIYLDNNNFTSVPLGCFDGLSSLNTLSLSQNSLSPWPFPTELKSSTTLETLYLDNTNVMGSIPDIFVPFSALKNVRLSYNNLTGSLPASFAKSSIQNLWLNNQAMGLSGTLDVLSGMPQLTQVWLHNNRFTGPIPDLSECISLFDLSLRDNQLTGIVPDSVISLPALVNVSLQNNLLQGPYPAFPSKVQKISIDNNNFCLNSSQPGKPCDPQVTTLLQIAGAMGYPVDLADSWTGNDPCASWSSVTCDPKGNIITINLANKQLKGTISPAYGNLTALQNLLLQQNNLTGPIPDSLTKIATLKSLDVSNNNLSGKVPTFGVNVKLTTTPGNPFIGTDVDTTPGTPGSPGSPPSGASGSGKGKYMSHGIIAAIVIVVLIFVAVVFFVVYKFVVKRRHGKFGRVKNPEGGNGNEMPKNGVIGGIGMNKYIGVPSELHSQSSGDHSDHRLFEGGNVSIPIEVLRQVTDNFNEANILGRGGFGVVYKGELHDGTKIAVKRMESNSMGTKGMSEFQAEIAVLTKVRHRHLVALLGYCVNGIERLLVYEYMPQGTLGQRLFEWHELGYNAPLTWKQRITIALDVARGVEYLHSLAQQSFIHRDLKPNNILIGDDMRAKVADFGLVKNAPDGKYSVETKLAGTFGYLAPEYAATGRVTTKIDVYAYGVVLMEIITGRKALDDSMPDDKAHLVTWFRRILVNKDNITKALDETLNPDEETLESIFKVAELAGHCTAREPYQRPDMGHAVNVLGPLVEQWIPANNEDEESLGIDLHMSLPQALQRWQANEGTSTMYGGGLSISESQSSIPSKPSGLADTFNSSDCR